MKRILLGGALVAIALVARAERIELRTDRASCVVETRGGRIMSFRPADGEEVVWQADPVQTDDPKWAHGGIPVCWPWFGVNGKVEIHGTAWRDEFRVVSKRQAGRRAELMLALDGEKARLEYKVSIDGALKLELKTINTSSGPFPFLTGFHPYFRVGDVTKCAVGGVNPDFSAGGFTKPIPLAEPLDDVFPAAPGSCSAYRLADPVLDRTLYVFAENSTRVNIWNPGAPKDTPGFIPGDTWRQFACVEPIVGRRSDPVVLKPGDDLTLTMTVEVRRGSKASSRLDGSPFRVLYLCAQPDDFARAFSKQALGLVQAGAQVTVVTLCNGCKGRDEAAPAELAARRLREAQETARACGFERFIVLDCPDGELEPSRAWRERIGRLVRDIAPDMVLTHRTDDCHPDRRAVGQIVQDLACFLDLPSWCPDTPVPARLPFVLQSAKVPGGIPFWQDHVDLVMSDDFKPDSRAAVLFECSRRPSAREVEFLESVPGFEWRGGQD